GTLIVLFPSALHSRDVAPEPDPLDTPDSRIASTELDRHLVSWTQSFPPLASPRPRRRPPCEHGAARGTEVPKPGANGMREADPRSRVGSRRRSERRRGRRPPE